MSDFFIYGDLMHGEYTPFEESAEDFINNIELHESVKYFNVNVDEVLADLVNSEWPSFTIPYKGVLEEYDSKVSALRVRQYDQLANRTAEMLMAHPNSSMSFENIPFSININRPSVRFNINFLKIVHIKTFEKGCEKKQVILIPADKSCIDKLICRISETAENFKKFNVTSNGIQPEQYKLKLITDALKGNADVTRDCSTINGKSRLKALREFSQIDCSTIKGVKEHDDPIQKPKQRMAFNIIFDNNGAFKISNDLSKGNSASINSDSASTNEETIVVTPFEKLKVPQASIHQQLNENTTADSVSNAQTSPLSAHAPIPKPLNLEKFNVALEPNGLLINLKEIDKFNDCHGHNISDQPSSKNSPTRMCTKPDHSLCANKPKHQCLVCGKAYGTKSYLQIHLYNEHTTLMYKCTICNKKSYMSVYALNKHMVDCRPYRCTRCNFSSLDITLFRKHLEQFSHGANSSQNVSPDFNTSDTMTNSSAASSTHQNDLHTKDMTNDDE